MFINLIGTASVYFKLINKQANKHFSLKEIPEHAIKFRFPFRLSTLAKCEEM